MVVCGLGAAGSAGKASSARVLGGGGPRPRDCVDCEDDEAVQDGADALEATRAAADDDEEDGGGREGNADEDGGLEDEDAGTQPGTLLTGLGAGPPNRVLFFSFRTLVEFRWFAPTTVKFVFVAAALAHPLELDVAPCMPPRPGRLG